MRTTLPVIGRVMATLIAASGCVRRLPPAPVPAAAVPPGVAPSTAGGVRLVVDVVDGPTPVQRVHMQSQPVDKGNGRIAYRFFEAPELLCAASPCVAEVPAPTNLVVAFPVIGKPQTMELELLHVGPESSVYRRALSEYRDESGALRVIGIVAAAVGGAALVTGSVLLPVGLSDDSDPMTTAGGVCLGGGAALLAFGIWGMWADAPTFRPGSSNHFPMP